MNFKDIVYSEIEAKSTPDPVVSVLPTAKRQVIKINEIRAQKRKYKTSSTHKTGELLASSTDRVALFANEYIPEHFTNGDWVRYYLHVNGKREEVVPINHQKDGIKVIKKSEYDDGERHVLIVDELIKSVKLEIQISTQSEQETPFVSNMKLVTGKEVKA